MVLSLLTPFSASANENQVEPFKPNGQSESTMQLKAAIAEQVSMLEGGSKLHKELQGVSGSEEISVIIHLSEKPVALEKGIAELAGKKFTTAQAEKVKENVQAQQAFVKKEFTTKGISLKQGHTFNTVLNGFSATVKADDLEKILSIEGVTLVEPDTTVYALEDSKSPAPTTSSKLIKDDQIEAAMNTSLSFLGIKKLWDEGYKGQGIKVAVIDTGIDMNHPEFQGVYKGGKNFVPHTGTTYARPRADNDPSETSPLDRPAGTPEFNTNGSSFYTSHGTHVAGTIAAIGANEYGISGIAPKVELYAYRVLGAYGSGATSGIIAAIEHAVIQKMDVINLSLGGGTNTETDSGSFAINNAMMAGTISVLATGNSGPNRGTLGTPGSSRLGIAVGNSTNPETMHNGKVNVTVGSYSLSKQLNLMGTTFGKNVATQLQGEFDLIAVPGSGSATNYNGLNVTGKIVLVARGDIAFVDKIAFAKANGAAGVIIHNIAGGTNAPNPSGTFLGDSFGFLPTFDLSQTDGQAMRTALQSGAGKVTFGNFASTSTLGDDVNSSSSRGPSTPNFDIKPDVTAPGTNIMSSIAMYGADFPNASYAAAYDRYTGTSMATPHIAAIAALVKQANPTWSAFDVKVALSNTAKILDTTKYDVFSQGAGRVDAYAAAHSGVLAYALDTAKRDATGAIVENLKGTVTFGPQPLAENISVKKQILVKDLKGLGGDYNVTIEVTKPFADAKLTVDKSSFTLNGEQLLNVTLTASKNTATKAGDEILGYIHITSVGGKDLSLPFAADFNGKPLTEVTNMNITQTDLSFDGDGVQDEAVLSFTLKGDVKTTYVELWDINNPTGGFYKDGYIGYVYAGTTLATGSYTLPIKGQYKPWGSAPTTTIPDGLYTMDFSAIPVSGNPASIGDFVGPIVVKTTKPAIAGSVASGQVTGQVTDKYIDYNAALANYSLSYDLNEKLKASYVITKNGVAKPRVSFKLAQNGSFAIPVGSLDAEKDSITIRVEDASGNVSEKLILGVVEPRQPIKVTPLPPIPSEPIATNPYVNSFGFSSIAISPNGDGINDTANWSFNLKETRDIMTLYVLDPQKYTNTPKPGGYIGDILFDTTKSLSKSGTFDGSYTSAYTFAKGPLKNGVYGFRLNGTGTGKPALDATIQPMFVKTAVPVITGRSATDVEGPEYAMKGKVTDQFFDFKAPLEQHFKVVNFDVNNYLKAKYVVQDRENTTVDEGIFTIGADGSYSINLTNLEKGQKYIVSVVVQDIAGNTALKEYTVETVAIPDVVTLSVDQTELDLTAGDTANLTVTQTTTPHKEEATKENVTALATYTVADEEVATVNKGVVTAVSAGSTTITVSYGGNKVTVEVTVIPAPVVSLSVDQATLDLTAGDKASLTVTQTTKPYNGEATNKDVTTEATYTVANEEVATVNKGVVTAVSAGSTTITVSYGGNKVTVEVTVIPVPGVSLSVDQATLDLTAGDTAKLTVTQTTKPYNGEATNKDVTTEATYTVANEEVATVNKGVVTAVSAGSTTITVSYGGNEVTVEVTVIPAPVVSLSVDQATLDLTAGDTASLTVTQTTKPYNGEATNKDVTTEATYTVANEEVATVNKGVVTAVSAGSTNVTVSYGGHELTVKVTVTDPIPEPVVTLSVNQSLFDLTTGDMAKVTVTQTTTPYEGEATTEDVTAKATYTVADENVVLASKGYLDAVGEGSTSITVSYGGNEVTVYVTVKDPTPDPKVTLSVDKENVSLKVGETEQITVFKTVKEEGKDPVTTDVTDEVHYSFENGQVVNVDRGLITAKGVGTATVSIRLDGNTVEVKVTVVESTPEPVKSLSVDKTTVSLTTGFTSQLTVKEITTAKDGEPTEKDVTKEATYTVTDPKVVTVTKGLVTAKAKGTTTITVSYGGKTVTVNVSVADPVIVNPPVDPKPVDPKPVTPPVFSDITNIFAKKEINILAAKGIIQGKTETNFAPNAQITRAEFAVLLARALNLPLNAYEGTFNDVNTSKKWAFAAIEAAAKAGIVNGTTDGSFNPDAPIKREEIAAMVVRAVEYQNKAKLDNLETPANFKDHGSIGAFAIESVYKATALGVILGNEGQFNPKNNATRAEAAVMLYRALDKLELLK